MEEVGTQMMTVTVRAEKEELRQDNNSRPLVVNVLNFARGGASEPTLLSFDDARTLFHEFGHALHALLSDVTYPMVSSTSVLSRYCRLRPTLAAQGAITQRPLCASPSRFAKTAGESKRGRHAQSIDPSRPTSAAVKVLPIIA